MTNHILKIDMERPLSITYLSQGNIKTKSDVSASDYQYDINKIHAVNEIPNPLGAVPSSMQAITYNSAHQPELLVDGMDKLAFTYGPHFAQRSKTVHARDFGGFDLDVETRYFVDDYEYRLDGAVQNPKQEHIHYVTGNGLNLIVVKENGGGYNYYYTYQDYLGSILTVTDDAAGIVYEQNFDPWGDRMQSKTKCPKWTFDEGTEGPCPRPSKYCFCILSPPTWLYRGFTGHEHLHDAFQTINMNGRLYDPIVGRMLSVDNYVADANSTQAYNRYTYALNNPLSYTDPDGEWVHIAIGAVIGGVVNWAANGAQFNAEGLGYFGVGALAGALAAGVGAGIGTAMAGGSFGAGFAGTTTVAGSGFIAGAASGAGAGFASGFTTGFGNTLVNDGNIGQAFGAGLELGGIGALTGGVAGGISGGIHASKNELNFWNGTARLDISQGFGAHNVPQGLDNITGKYVGKYEGVNVYESPEMGGGGLTLPGRGIIVGKGSFSQNLRPALMQHEFGHILQAREFGLRAFYKVIGPQSLGSAALDGVGGHYHRNFWTETWANYKASQYFGSNYINKWYFPIEQLSTYHRVELLIQKYNWMTWPF